MDDTREDADLLAQFTREGSEPAFRELVERHIRLVTTTALRITAGDIHLAQDVTQRVFTDLARKAHALPTGTVLGGWLYRHACFTAAKAIRTESRRRAREKTAMELSVMNEDPTPDENWHTLAPVLDDALNHLGEDDRDAVVLRFFQQRDLRSVGHSLRVSEDAAQKRIARALEKLRVFLTRRGVTLSTALLATTLDAGAKTAVPAGLAATVSASALSNIAAQTTFTLASLKSMMTTKLVLGAAAGIVLAGAATLVIQHQPTSAQPTVLPVIQAAPASKLAPASKATATSVPTPPAHPVARIEAPAAAPQTGTGPTTPIAETEIIEAQPTLNLVKLGEGTLTFTDGVLVEEGFTATGTLHIDASAAELENGTIMITDGAGKALGIDIQRP